MLLLLMLLLMKLLLGWWLMVPVGLLLAAVIVVLVAVVVLLTGLTTSIRVLWSELDNFGEHGLGRVDTLPSSLDGDLAVVTRRYVLINLDVTARAFL